MVRKSFKQYFHPEAFATLNDRYDYVLSSVSLWSKIATYGQRYGQLVADYFFLMTDKFSEFLYDLDEKTKTDIVHGGLHPVSQQEIRPYGIQSVRQLCDEAIAIEHRFCHSGRWPLEDKGSGLGGQGTNSLPKNPKIQIPIYADRTG